MSASTSARVSVIYECPECETRYLDERRCPDCNLFTRRIGPGGSCPHCLLTELLLVFTQVKWQIASARLPRFCWWGRYGLGCDRAERVR